MLLLGWAWSSKIPQPGWPAGLSDHACAVVDGTNVIVAGGMVVVHNRQQQQWSNIVEDNLATYRLTLRDGGNA